MSHNQYAKVTDNQPVGPEIYRLTLEAPAIAAAARPGQFVMLRVGPGPEPCWPGPFPSMGWRAAKC